MSRLPEAFVVEAVRAQRASILTKGGDLKFYAIWLRGGLRGVLAGMLKSRERVAENEERHGAGGVRLCMEEPGATLASIVPPGCPLCAAPHHARCRPALP